MGKGQEVRAYMLCSRRKVWETMVGHEKQRVKRPGGSLSKSNGYPRSGCHSIGLDLSEIHGTIIGRLRSHETGRNWSPVSVKLFWRSGTDSQDSRRRQRLQAPQSGAGGLLNRCHPRRCPRLPLEQLPRSSGHRKKLSAFQHTPSITHNTRTLAAFHILS